MNIINYHLAELMMNVINYHFVELMNVINYAECHDCSVLML